MHQEKKYSLFDNLNVKFFQTSSQKNITYGQSRVLWWLLGSEGFVG